MDRFAEAAFYYKYRPAWPEDLIAELARVVNTSRNEGICWDIGAGTGSLTIPLSRHFRVVHAVEPSVPMLAELEKDAAAGEGKIVIHRLSDKDLPANLPSFNLAVFGRSFHWMDRNRLLDVMYDMTLPGGAVAILSDASYDQDSEPWQSATRDVMKRYVGEIGWDKPQDWLPHKELLASRNDWRMTDISRTVRRHATVEEIVNRCLSYSWCAPSALGEKCEEFVETMRSELSGHAQEGLLHENAEITALLLRPV
ncbi:MAG: methyltransferase domain-containing protein [Alphaproteobacteria bacterium]|nr:methyltransferase domain-containing protein [Alphaproteobacteria bacterium]